MFQSLAAVEIWALINPKATSETLPKVSAEAVVWAKSVSYTHLTLPTILRV